MEESQELWHFEELQRWLARQADISDMPALGRTAGKMLFITIAERWIESQHASAAKVFMGAPHYSCVHLAFRSAIPGLTRMIRTDPTLLESLSQDCMQVRNPRKALVQMGFWQHPGVQQKVDLVFGKVRSIGRSWRRWAVDLLYHCDMDTVYKDLDLVSEFSEIQSPLLTRGGPVVGSVEIATLPDPPFRSP